MKTIVLNIGEVWVDAKPSLFTCYGIGSCIGLFLQDRQRGLTGGAHILLPDKEPSLFKDGKYYNVEEALGALLTQMKEKGSNLQSLRAKVAGGATLHTSNINVGEKNINSIMNYLVARKIFIAAKDLGGNHSRTVSFDSKNGILHVKSSANNSYYTY